MLSVQLLRPTVAPRSLQAQLFRRTLSGMAGPTTQTPLDEREMAAWDALIRAPARVVRRREAELESERGLTLQGYEVLAHLSEAPHRQARTIFLAALVFLIP